MARRRDRGAVAELREARRRAKRPCRSAPAAPTNGQTIWETTDGNRFDRIRGRFRWDEVTTDIANRPISVRRYIVQVQHSKDQVNWSEPDRRVVAAKDDDANTTAHVVIRGIHKRLFYRWRVRAEDRHGCRSAWAGWFPSATGENPVDPDAPPAPMNVTLVGKLQRIVADWDLAEDPLDTDPDVRTVDPRIAHIQYQIATDAGFSQIAKRGRFGTREHMAWTPPDSLASSTFYFRVRSINAEGTRSAWVVANNGVGVQLASAAGQLVLVWSIHGKWRTGRIKKRWIADGTYRFRKARIYVGDHDPATHPDDWCPRGSRLRVQGKVVSADETVETNLFDTDDRLIVEPDTHKDINWASSFNVSQIQDGETLLWDVRSVGSTFPGRDGTIVLVVEKV